MRFRSPKLALDVFYTSIFILGISVCYSNQVSKDGELLRSQRVAHRSLRQIADSNVPKVLDIDYGADNVNTYLDDPDNNTNLSLDAVDYGTESAASVSVACRDKYGHPFPGFICPLMQVLSTEYPIWRRKIAMQRICDNLTDLNAHPCDHRTSSCVVLSLPNSHVIFGCIEDSSGRFVAPRGWNTSTKNSFLNHLFDFKIRNPLRLTSKCRELSAGDKPICMRNNVFYKWAPLVQRMTCCCKGDFCADALFDQVGFNPLPFIHVSLDMSPNGNRSDFKRESP